MNVTRSAFASRAACVAAASASPAEAGPGRPMASTSVRHPRRLVAVAAEALVEGDPGQVVDPVGERALAVLGQEERGVAQARHDDALHPAHDLAGGGPVAVRDGGEALDAAPRRRAARSTSGGGRGPSRGPRAAASGTPRGPRRSRRSGTRRGRATPRAGRGRRRSSPAAFSPASMRAVRSAGARITNRSRKRPLQLGEGADLDRPSARALRQEAVATSRPAALARRPGPSPRPRPRGWRTARRPRRAGRRASGWAGRTGTRRGRRRATRPSSSASGRGGRAGRRPGARAGPRRVGRPATFLTKSR